MYDLVVIGGGYWGIGVAIEAKRKGWNTIVVDSYDKQSGSRNASAICDPAAYKSSVFNKYWPSDWHKSELDASLNWLLANGGEWVQERFWNHFAGTEPREGGKCIYLQDNFKILSRAPRTLGKVCGIDKASYGWNITISSLSEAMKFWTYQTKRVVVAAGYHTGELLVKCGIRGAPDVGKLYGRGVVASGVPEGFPDMLPMTVMIKPYVKHTIRQWHDGYRIGDTGEATPNDNKLAALEEIGGSVLTGYQRTEIVAGYRPTCDRYVVEKVAPSLVVATGGHRVGLGLTGLVARRVLRCFE